MNYYNENDPQAAAWLRELIRARLIARGEVDERSIINVTPGDLRPYRQCHFFAGIGGWSYSLRLAGWPDQRPVWTGSCPCQPFSCAGQGLGEADPRHLWPFFRNLIGQCRPAIVFGEQVASAAGRKWLAGIRADLAQLVYRFGAADLCAAGVAAPHIRQRLWWMAHAHGGIARHGRLQPSGRFLQQPRHQAAGGVADDSGQRWNGRPTLSPSSGRSLAENGSPNGGLVQSDRAGRDAREPDGASARHGRAPEPASGGMGHAGTTGFSPPQSADLSPARWRVEGRAVGQPSVSSAWSDFDLIRCTDETWRRIESGTFPLAHGVPRGVVEGRARRLYRHSDREAGACSTDAETLAALVKEFGEEEGLGRVMMLRGYGNAIVAPQAVEFIRAAMEALQVKTE